ncbi:MAG: glycosyltransferase family 2 protein [Actinomycetota bacterium]
MTGPRLSVVIVTFNHRDELARTLPPLVEQLREDDELIVADNGSQDGTRELVAELAPGAELVEMGANTGFAAAANAGAEAAAGELLVFLNPDATPLDGFAEAIRRPWVEGRGWAAWMGLVACDGGRTVNTSGNPVHFTGFAWAGEHGRPLPADLVPHEVPSASGACLALPLDTFDRLGGFPDRYFLYHEDVDLSMRLRLEGGAIGLEPGAVVDHEYEFEASAAKMRWLERNRWAFLTRVYPAPLLVLLAPALLLTELALIPVSVAGGWGWQKLLADLDGLRRLPWALRSRRQVQRRRQVSAADFAAWLTPDLDSPFFGRTGRSRLVGAMLRAYWRVVRALLGSPREAGERGGSGSR